MRIPRLFLLLLLVWAVALPSATNAASRAKQGKQGKEAPSKKEDPERALTGMIRQIQMDLEGSSSRGILSNINSAKFDDYPRFQDMIERLTREDTLRVYFRQVSNSVKEDSAQTILDAEMEMTRKDAAGQVERRRQQLIFDFERTARGWKIINITPRDFFRPL